MPRFRTALGFLLISTLILTALPASLYAEGEEETQRPAANFSTVLWSGYAADAGFDVGEGSVAVTRMGVDLNLFQKVSLGYAVRLYDWSDIDRLWFSNGTDEPWKALNAVYLDLHDRGSFNKTWGWFAGVLGGMGFEEQTDGSYLGSVRGGVDYTFPSGLTVRVGAFYFKDAVDNTVLPILGIGYKPLMDRRGKAGWFASLGFPRTQIGYRFDPTWALRASFRWDRAAARLADDSPVYPEGHVRFTDGLGELNLDYSPTENLYVSLGAGMVFMRTLNFYNEDGRVLAGTDVDNTLGGSLVVRYTF